MRAPPAGTVPHAAEPAAGTLCITVRDHHGRPLALHHVLVRTPFNESVDVVWNTAAAGTACVPSGWYRVAAWNRGNDEAEWFPATRWAFVPAGGSSHVELVGEPAGALVVHLDEPAGGPPRGCCPSVPVVVEAVDVRGVCQPLVVDHARGRHRRQLRPGEYRVRVAVQERTIERLVTVGHGGTTILRMTLPDRD